MVECKDCMHWELIGDAKAVAQYKEEHKELPETVFKNFIPEEKDTRFYGRCKKYNYDAIKKFDTHCLQFEAK